MSNLINDMHVEKLYDENDSYMTALFGMALSYYDGLQPVKEWWDEGKIEKAKLRAKKLAFMQGGHNKFLESINVSFYIEAPRSFWSEFDTYRVGVTKQSSSSMHTLVKSIKNGTEEQLFNQFTCNTPEGSIRELERLIHQDEKNITAIKSALPEGFIQHRQVSLNYKVLQGIIHQRKGHRLKYWDILINHILNEVNYPELLVKDVDQFLLELKV